jgi:hypothetical protein
MKRALLAVVVLSSGCLNIGRMESQRSIDELGREIHSDVDAIVVAARTSPVSKEIADRVASIDDKATHIRKWTALTRADLGRAEGDVDLSDDGQARARALYEQEIKKREMLARYAHALAGRAGIPVNTPGDAGVGDYVTDAAGMIFGPGIAGVLGLFLRRERKKRKAMEQDNDRKRRAIREAIAVIGQSKDTSIRQTAAMKSYLLEEFADAKMVEYDDRIREIRQGPMFHSEPVNAERFKSDHSMDAANYSAATSNPTTVPSASDMLPITGPASVDGSRNES